MSPSKIRIFYPADPVGVVPGGIDTFIRGVIKWAPPELDFSLVGMSTDAQQRPAGRWTRCEIGARTFDFFPVVQVADAGGRGRVPLSVRFCAGAWRHHDKLLHDFDMFDFHRVEPILMYGKDPRAKNAYFHQDPTSVRLKASDNLWRRLPAGYERVESRAVSHLSSAWCVRESGVQTLRQRYPTKAGQIQFIPTWVDTEVFYPAAPRERAALRQALALELGIGTRQAWVVSVGRLDTQKNPALLLKAFARLRAQGWDAVLLLVGDGVLRRDLERQAHDAGIADQVHFLGLLPPQTIANLLRAADLFAMPSAYEGMPMALLEALGSGTPAVVTDVGEVRRVVQHGVNGLVVTQHDESHFAAALGQALAQSPHWREAAVAAVTLYQPARVLAPVYDNYLALAHGFKSLREAASSQAASRRLRHRHAQVVTTAVDVMGRTAFTEKVLRWAEARESRYAVFCNVHSAMLATHDERHRLALEGADLVAPDGAPIAWTLRRKGHPKQRRLAGPDAMLRLCTGAAAQHISIGLFGSTPQVLAALKTALQTSFPGLDIAYVHSPPFRALTAAEDNKICSDIARANVGMLFVGLGCPKQEIWMAQHRGRIPAVMLGLGAAFDFHAGLVQRAPGWMRENGLEWLHRLGAEPKRLGARYLVSNSQFIAHSVKEALLAPLLRRTVRVIPALPALPALTTASEWAHTVMISPPAPARARLDKQQIEVLSARIDAALPPTSARLVGFIASGVGEGTSTVARAYAQANAAPNGRRVLLVSAAQPSSAGSSSQGPGLLEALRSGRSLDDAVTRHSRGVFVASLGPVVDSDRAWSVLASRSVLEALRNRFELVALDMPASAVSSAGLKMAALCDGIVVVMEAGKTRAPVVAHLIDNLIALRATVLGTVLNKRRYPLPARLYRWL